MRLINKRQLREKIGGYSNTHIVRLIQAGRLPAPLKPFGRNGKSLWNESVVDHFLSKWEKVQDS